MLLYNNILIIIVDFIKFSDLLFRQEKLTGNLLGLKRLPRKCYKCNCQQFEPSSNNEEICNICKDDEGEHHQVR